MSNFFNPTVTRTQPARQEGVVDTSRVFNIEGYTFENNTLATPANITFSAAAASTGTFTVTATVNPGYLAFSGQNVRTVNVSIVSGDSIAVQASKVRAALLSDLLFSAYFNVFANATSAVILPKQAYETQAFLSGLTGTPPGASYSAGTAGVALPFGSAGRLVYTPSSSSASVVRTIEAGATGVLRGMTAWCPEVEYNDILKASSLRPFYMHDVLTTGIMNVDGVSPVTQYVASPNLFVYITGVNAGRIRVGTDTGAVALTPASFPNLSNLGNCTFGVHQLSFAGSSLYKLSMEID